MRYSRRTFVKGGLGAMVLGALPAHKVLAAGPTTTWFLERPFYGQFGASRQWTANAIPLTGRNTKYATKRAIALARAFFTSPSNSNARLVLRFPAGRYVFGSENESGRAIQLNNFFPGTTGRLVIRGASQHDTTFVVANNQNQNQNVQWGIDIRNSARISFRDFHITVDKPTVTQGEVYRSGNNFVDLKIEPQHLDPTQIPDNIRDAGRYLRRYWNRNNPTVDQGFEQIAWTNTWRTRDAERVFRFRTRKTPAVSVGNLIGVKAKSGGELYRVIDCQDIGFHSIKFTRKTRGLFLRCERTTLTGLVMQREWINGAPACLASPGGGPQFHSRQGGIVNPADCNFNDRFGTGVRILNCSFDGTGDDSIGLFEQRSPFISGCTFKDSFARGIFAHRCENVRQQNNRIVRAPTKFENPC